MRTEFITVIKTALDNGAFAIAEATAKRAAAAGHRDVADRAFAAIARLRAAAVVAAPAIKAQVKVKPGLYTVADELGHVTLRVEKQEANAKFAPGETIIGRLIGPNNDADYQGVAFLKTADGRVVMWKKACGDARLEAAIRVLVGDPKAAALRYAQVSARCYICNCTLTTPSSLALGIGPTCAEKGY